MQSLLCTGIISFCALASFGCGSGAPQPKVVGSYSVMITSAGASKTDSEVMTVTQGAGGKLLFTFGAGITTDLHGPNSDGLIATQSGANVTLDMQPVTITEWTGRVSGNVTGTGKLSTDGSCALTLQFTPSGGAAAVEYDVSGSLLQ